MNRSGFAALALAGFCPVVIVAADATSPVDYTQRNTPYAVGGSTAVMPEKQTPVPNAAVQEKRFEKTMVEKPTAPIAGRRAGIEIKEMRDKTVWEKDSHRPAGREQPTSSYDHRVAPISTSTDKTKPPTVAKYQDSLTAASASNMARFPALDRATTVKINRFVFRKNPPDAASPGAGQPVTAAASAPAEANATRPVISK